MVLKCIALKCKKKIPTDKLLCPAHWGLVPSTLKNDLIENFDPRRDTTMGKMSPSFRKIVSAAVRDIAVQEGHDDHEF